MPLVLSHYEGYLFFRRSGRRWKGAPVMSSETAGAFFAKWRNGLGCRFPSFLDRYEHKSFECVMCLSRFKQKELVGFDKGFCPKCNGFLRAVVSVNHRVSWHSLRRFYENGDCFYFGYCSWCLWSSSVCC